MTKPDRHAIALIVDRSGSMERIVTEAQQAIDEFVAEQSKLGGEVLWTIVFFNKEYDRPIFNQVGSTFEVPLEPRGMTALHDAVGRTVDDLGAAFEAMPEDERPSKVIVATITDGQENSSEEYTAAQVAERVKRQTDEWQWEFHFLGAGMNRWRAEKISGVMGMSAQHTHSVADQADYYAGTQVVSNAVRRSRTEK